MTALVDLRMNLPLKERVTRHQRIQKIMGRLIFDRIGELILHNLVRCIEILELDHFRCIEICCNINNRTVKPANGRKDSNNRQ